MIARARVLTTIIGMHRLAWGWRARRGTRSLSPQCALSRGLRLQCALPRGFAFARCVMGTSVFALALDLLLPNAVARTRLLKRPVALRGRIDRLRHRARRLRRWRGIVE